MNYYRMKHSETEGVGKFRQCYRNFILIVTVSYQSFEKHISAESLSTSLHLKTHPIFHNNLKFNILLDLLFQLNQLLQHIFSTLNLHNLNTRPLFPVLRPEQQIVKIMQITAIIPSIYQQTIAYYDRGMSSSGFWSLVWINLILPKVICFWIKNKCFAAILRRTDSSTCYVYLFIENVT